MLRRGQTEESSVPPAEVEHIDSVPYPAPALQDVHITAPAPTCSVAGCLNIPGVASRGSDQPLLDAGNHEPEQLTGTGRHFTDRRLARMLARNTVPCAHAEHCVREIVACETLPLCGECHDEDPGNLLLACPGCLHVEDAIFTDSDDPVRTVSATPTPESSVPPTSSQPSLEFGSTTVSDVDTFSMTHSSGASTPRVSASPPNYPDEPPHQMQEDSDGELGPLVFSAGGAFTMVVAEPPEPEPSVRSAFSFSPAAQPAQTSADPNTSPPNYPDQPPGPDASPSACRTRSDRQ